jgi:ribose transport system ATP-binding protein
LGQLELTVTLLTARNVSKSYGATVALESASIELISGEVHVLLGENGAGKSTLGKIIAGLVRPDGGEISVAGEEMGGRSVRWARSVGIEIVLQELSLIPQLSVAENLFLGKERRAILLNPAHEREMARGYLRQFGLECDPRIPVERLAQPDRQLLEIAKAARAQPKIIVMDEPSSRLTEKEKHSLYAVVESLKKSGTAILYVTHHLDEVLKIGGRVSGMRGGRIAETLQIHRDMTENDLVRILTGRASAKRQERLPRRDTLTMVDARKVTVGGACKDVSITIQVGEIVGIYGVVGCGREDFGRALVGIAPTQLGEFHIEGIPYRPRSPASAAAAGITYLPGDRKERGILAQRSLTENLKLSEALANGMFRPISPSRQKKSTEACLRELKVRFLDADKPISALSGGNQQKVLFGRAIATKPRLVVMEDPTAGIDVGAKAELYAMCDELSRSGTSILLISSDIKETIMICHRIYTMFEGRIVGEFKDPGEEVEDMILADVLGRQRLATDIQK